MAKEKSGRLPTWKESMKEFGGGSFTFLGTDGECLIFIVVGPPQLLKTEYKGKEQQRIGCPIVTDEGYQLFICGKRLARKLSKHEEKFSTNAIMVVRRGAEGDVNAKYEITILPEPETYNRLAAIRDADFTPDMIFASVEEAEGTLGG